MKKIIKIILGFQLYAITLVCMEEDLEKLDIMKKEQSNSTSTMVKTSNNN